MPAPEYQRTANLQPTLLPELKGGEAVGTILNTLADRLRDYVKGPAPNQNQRSNNSAGQPGQSGPSTQSPPQSQPFSALVEHVAEIARGINAMARPRRRGA
jgi:hypothetical protein